MTGIDFRLNPPIDSPALNVLYAASWPRHIERDDWPELAHSLAHIWAWDGERLAGFVYVAWDGGVHAFLLDPTVHPDYRRRGLGLALVKQAELAAKAAGCEWLHVDYEEHLDPFYRAAGFRPTLAGLIRLWDVD
ncbi:MAG: GNAT family N-acetyltransferase [Caldilineaceae bacterium]|nr:GNAT family N-acetyltransferase [Caldilineaceae bacterium]